MANEIKETKQGVEEVSEAKKSKEQLEIESLKAQLELLTKMVMQNTGSAHSGNNPSDSVTVVHMVERAPGLKTHIELSNMTIDFRSFGEERTLPRMVFEELIGKYRRWFELGILAPGPNAGDIAAMYNLTVSNKMGITTETIKKIPKMSVTDLETLYNKLGKAHQQYILEIFRRGVLENKPDFRDIHKLEMLNRVSDGALDSVLTDIKVEQTRASKQKK